MIYKNVIAQPNRMKWCIPNILQTSLIWQIRSSQSQSVLVLERKGVTKCVCVCGNIYGISNTQITNYSVEWTHLAVKMDSLLFRFVFAEHSIPTFFHYQILHEMWSQCFAFRVFLKNALNISHTTTNVWTFYRVNPFDINSTFNCFQACDPLSRGRGS